MCTTASSSSSLKFGIEQILSPHFGISSLCMMATAAAAAATTTTSAISPLSSTNSLAPSPNSSQSGMCSPSSISPSFATNTSLSTVNPLNDNRTIFPAWVFCTRYSDRPSAGPRHRKSRKRESTGSSGSEEEKRPRTAFTSDQLDRLQQQFHDNRYLTEKRRQELAHELGLNESQIKIWFQNKRAKLKKASGDRTPMSFQMMTQLSQQSANAIRP